MDKKSEEVDFFAEHVNDDNNEFAQDSNHNKSGLFQQNKPITESFPKVSYITFHQRIIFVAIRSFKK